MRRAPGLLAAALVCASAAAEPLPKAACPPTSYPQISDLFRFHPTGSVDVILQVSAEGMVTGTSVPKSSGHPRIDMMARESLEQCRFPSVTSASTIKMRYMWDERRPAAYRVLSSHMD